MINTLKFQLYKNDKDDNFYEFARDNEVGIKCEAVIFAVCSFGAYVISHFEMYMIIPFILAMYNLILAWIKISEAKYELKKKSIKYLIEYNVNLLFKQLDILSNIMREKGLPEKDIEKWKKYYINKIIEKKSLNNIISTNEDIRAHFYKIALIEFPAISEKDILKFMKKESAEWFKKYYPKFKEDLSNNAFGKQRSSRSYAKTSNSGNSDNPANNMVHSNMRLEQSLRVLGLPSTVRDMNMVKSRYYELIKKHHPDAPQNKDKDRKEVQDKIIEINIAYQEIEKILKNQNRGF